MARMVSQNMKAGTPAKPKTLTEAAALEWDRLMADLDESGIRLAKAHGELLAMAATIAADIADAQETVKLEGAYVTNEKTGALQAHPAARRLDNLRRDYLKVLSLLGLRSAVQGGGSGKPQSLADLLNG